MAELKIEYDHDNQESALSEAFFADVSVADVPLSQIALLLGAEIDAIRLIMAHHYSGSFVTRDSINRLCDVAAAALGEVSRPQLRARYDRMLSTLNYLFGVTFVLGALLRRYGDRLSEVERGRWTQLFVQVRDLISLNLSRRQDKL